MTDRTKNWAEMAAECAIDAANATDHDDAMQWIGLSVANALLAIHDTLTAADRYAANEAKQREAGAGCPTLIECLRTLEAIRPGTDDRPSDAAYVDGLTTAYDHLRSVLVEHGVGVSPRVDEPEIPEAAEWLSLDEDDPLDEDDHRDRLDGNGLRVKRKPSGYWAWEGAEEVEGWTLDDIHRHQGPLTFAPEATQEATGGDLSAPEGESEAEGGGEADDTEEPLLCECGHDIDEHGWEADYAITCCLACDDPADCRKAPSDIARALIEQAANIERTRLTGQLRLTTSSVQDSGDLAELDALADEWEAR